MYPGTYSIDEQANWRATVLTASAWSRHFVLAVIFNLLNVLQLTVLFKRHHDMAYLGMFLILVVFLLAMLGYYATALYQLTRERLKTLQDDSAEAQALLRVSYLGYRLYLMGLGFGFVVLGFFNLTR